jgi:hypothetical protein
MRKFVAGIILGLVLGGLFAALGAGVFRNWNVDQVERNKGGNKGG